MATIKGENLRILMGADTQHLTCVAASTNAVVHLSLQVEEDTTKDTVDDWIEQEPVGLNWDVQTEALVISDDEETGFTPDQLVVGALYLITFSRTIGAAGEQNRDEDSSSPINMSGVAILSDLQINSQNGELSTYTAQFTGHGELSLDNPSADDEAYTGPDIEERPVDPEGF